MVKLLLLSDIFETSIYRVGKNESLIDIAVKTKVPPRLIIDDNNLVEEPKCGQLLVIKRRGNIKILQPNADISPEKLLRIKMLNNVPYLYPFQIVFDCQ